MFRLPDLIENASDEAQLLAGDLAKSTADGMDAAGTALWAAAVDLGGSAAEQVLRRALAPVHDYWTSMSRVQAALDKERAALPSPSQSTEGTTFCSSRAACVRTPMRGCVALDAHSVYL